MPVSPRLKLAFVLRTLMKATSSYPRWCLWETLHWGMGSARAWHFGVCILHGCSPASCADGRQVPNAAAVVPMPSGQWRSGQQGKMLLGDSTIHFSPTHL